MSTSAIGAAGEPHIIPRCENCDATLLIVWAGPILAWLQTGLCWTMPIYPRILQKRAYGQGWPPTALKPLVLGTAYFVLMPFAAQFAGFAGLAKL